MEESFTSILWRLSKPLEERGKDSWRGATPSTLTLPSTFHSIFQNLWRHHTRPRLYFSSYSVSDVLKKSPAKVRIEPTITNSKSSTLPYYANDVGCRLENFIVKPLSKSTNQCRSWHCYTCWRAVLGIPISLKDTHQPQPAGLVRRKQFSKF